MKARLMKASIPPDLTCNGLQYCHMVLVYKSVSEETTTGVDDNQTRGTRGCGLPHLPDGVLHDYVERTKFDNVYGTHNGRDGRRQ
eukprot:4504000-Heterocapsa_arctica.AAC.1